MEENPYESPYALGSVRPKPLYTPLRLMMDVFCIAAPLVPIGLWVAIEWFHLPPLPTAAARMTFLAMMAGSWLVSLVLNFAGTLRIRVVSIIGIVLNLISLMLVLLAP